MFPLAFGVVPERFQNSVVEFIKSRGMACSVYGAQILLDGLYSSNESGYALTLLTSTSDRGWWNMIRSGSTITMEAWDMKYKPNSDWNHAWGAAPANIITRQLWGIRPLEPGFRKALIRPQMGSLTSSQIKVPTIRGPVSASFRIINNTDLYSVDIPAGMEAEFDTGPSGYYKEVIANKKKLKHKTQIILLKSGHYDIELSK